MKPENLPFEESGDTGRPAAGPLAFWVAVAWSLWLSLEYWVLGDLSYLHYHDNADQIIPLFQWLGQSFPRLNGAEQIPVLCGVDRFACSAWINAFNLPFLFLPAWLANGLVIFLQRFVACWFTIRFGREVLRMPMWTAVAAGMAYPLLPFEHGELRLMHGFNEPGLPFLLWLFASCRFTGWLQLLGVAVASGFVLSMCMGPISAMPFFLPTAVLIALVMRPDLRRPLALLQLAVFVGVLLIAYIPMLLPTLKSILGQAGGGHRADWGTSAGFIPVLATELIANLRQLGSIWWTIPLALPCVLGPRGAGRTWSGIIVLVLIGFVLGPLAEAFAKSQGEWIGIFQGFNFSRFNRVLPFACVLAAGYGLGRWKNGIGFGHHNVWAAVALTAVAATSWNLKIDHWGAMSKEGKSWRTTLGNRDVAALAAIDQVEPFRVATAGAYHMFHPQFWMQHDLEMADGYMVMYPNRYQKFWNQVVGPLVETQPELTGHFTRWGSRVYLFHSRDPLDACRLDVPFDQWYNRNLLSLVNTRYIISKKPMTHQDGLKLLPAAVTDAEQQAWVSRNAVEKVLGYLKGENPGRRYYIYENLEAFPRAFPVGEIRIFEGEEALFEALGDASLADLRTTGYLVAGEFPAAGLPEIGDVETSIQWKSHTDSAFELEVKADAPTVLLVSTLYYPGWRVVDGLGDDVETFPINGAFLGVQVPAGTTILRASYD